MKLLAYVFAALIAASMLSGCSMAMGDYMKYNFDRGETMDAKAGSEMFRVTHYWKPVTASLGNPGGGGGYSPQYSGYSLIYLGRQDSVIKLRYQEFSGEKMAFITNEYTAAAFSEELTFDISKSDTITYKNTKVRILEANNDKIRIVVLESPAYKYHDGLTPTHEMIKP